MGRAFRYKLQKSADGRNRGTQFVCGDKYKLVFKARDLAGLGKLALLGIFELIGSFFNARLKLFA